MTCISSKLIASIVLSSALWSGGAFAQANEGSGEIPRSLPGGGELPGNISIIETPKVDLDEVGRDVILDPEKMLRSYGTMSRSRSGEEKTEPPSGEVLRSLQGAEGTDPAFSEAGERQVFGNDDRVQITDASAYPFRTFGFLLAETPEGGHGACSATLIGPRTVITAAHCLYDHEKGWMDNFVFAPGMTTIENAPFGVWEYDTAYIFEGYVTNYQGSYGSVVPWDIAVVILQQPIGDYLGWLDFAHDPQLAGFHANIVGYPADKPSGTMWRVDCPVPPNAINEQNFAYMCDTYQGSSGASVYKYDQASQSRVIMGVHIAETQDFNLAVRMNDTYYNWVRSLTQ